MDQLQYWKNQIDEINEEIKDSMWGDQKRLYYLNARKRFCEFTYGLCLEEKNKKK